ncbi:DUF2399 domain-containing protein [Kribbella sp. NBC_01484]|uniref:DUF2399 domain-containing protein n=1 Tax=Kribbella sp. NBC_01484 TaxID=2903579 RepID=UPI002E31D6BC|nr:DUF2399 domain-containing protein [Kribbella sp. NBC_01484]
MTSNWSVGRQATIFVCECTIEARADFDQAGFTIADQILSVASDTYSWRCDTTTYAAICDLPDRPATARSLSEALNDLRVLSTDTRIPVHEERLLGDLLADLAAGNASPGMKASSR